MTLPDLARLVAEAAPDELAALAGRLREAELLVEMRLRSVTSTNGNGVQVELEPERVLTYAQAAEVVGCKESYVETLVRQHKLPTVTLPGTDKAGRSRDGKYRRILLSSLLAHLKAREEKAVDGWFNTVINSLHDRPRSAKNPKVPRAVPSGVREARGRDLRDGEPVGDGGDAHPGAHGEAHQAARQAG